MQPVPGNLFQALFLLAEHARRLPVRTTCFAAGWDLIPFWGLAVMAVFVAAALGGFHRGAQRGEQLFCPGAVAEAAFRGYMLDILRFCAIGLALLEPFDQDLGPVTLPEIFFPMVGDVRRCLVRTFPFGILFRYRNAQIEIIAVMHLKRNPGYGQERL